MTPRMTRRTLLGGILALCGGIPFVARAEDEVIVPPGEEEVACFTDDHTPVPCETVEVLGDTEGLEPAGGVMTLTPVPDRHAYVDESDGQVYTRKEVFESNRSFVIVQLPRTGTGH